MRRVESWRLGCSGIHPTLAVKRTRDLEVVGAVVEVGDDLLDLRGAVGADFGLDLTHYAGSPKLNAVIFVFHARLHFAQVIGSPKTDPCQAKQSAVIGY